MAVYSKILYTEKIEIEKNYSINISKIFQIKKGILNSNFLIETINNKKYILRIFEADRSLKEEEKELNFLNEICKFIPISSPVMTKNQKYILEVNNKKISLFKYIEGDILAETSENYLKEIGKYLGKIHKYSENIKKEDFNRKSRIDFDYYYYKIKKALSKKNKFEYLLSSDNSFELKNLLQIADKIKEINFNNLPSGIIHSDIFQDNIIVKNKKIKAILDFNEAHYNAFIYDIAIIINFWIKNKNFTKEKENNFIKVFLDSYSKYRKITKEEMDFLNLACKKIILLFILLRFYKENIEKIYSKNFNIEEKSYKELLNLLN